MRWRRGARSDDLRDIRGRRGGGGRGLALPVGAGLGLPGLLLVVLFMALSGGGGGGLGVDSPFGGVPSAPPAGPDDSIPRSADPDAELVDFVSFVLDDVQGTWEALLEGNEPAYRRAELVLFEDAVQSGCGPASAATGPFYCPPDEAAYVDLGFFRELSDRFGAPGDFAQAYVLAHEIGHHVQHVLGISGQVQRLRQQRPEDANELSVRLELQADCLAGVWGHSTYQRGLLEDGDLDEGLTAAAAVGDDRIQREAGRRVDRETWTHGSSGQRQRWFRRGFESGDPDDCDTFD